MENLENLLFMNISVRVKTANLAPSATFMS